MAQDPVCKMNVDEKKAAGTSSYKGKTYYFCEKSCKEKFDKEPEKYAGGSSCGCHSCH
ncbi:MAG: YHS domain-containing protein [Nitrospirae bacterium]|nr:YHS domain-containing protein [Nitrospirota bacterium]MBI4838295.1 YHS domain-containing protein [Nitrospirota bacterium]